MAVLGSNTLNHSDDLLIQRAGATRITVTSAGITVAGTLTASLNTGAVTAAMLNTGVAGTGVGYVRDGGAASSASLGFGHMTFQAPNGIRMLHQWGFTTGTSTTALTTANFHVPFKAGITPSVTCEVAGIVFGFVRTTSIGAISITDFQYQIRDNAGTAQANGIRWIATGEAP